MGRSPCCSKEGLNRGAWTALEDKILTAYIKAHGEGKWRNLPKRAGLKRCGKSCRLRWLNYLRPDIKRGNISHDEEELIIRLHKLLGNRWSLIAGRLPGRTDNEIKNYWNTTLGKKANAESKQNPSTNTRQRKLSTEPNTPKDKPSKSQKPAQVIHTKATRCTKVLIPPVLLPESHNTAAATSLNHPIAAVDQPPQSNQDFDSLLQFQCGITNEELVNYNQDLDFLNNFEINCRNEFQESEIITNNNDNNGETGLIHVDFEYKEEDLSCLGHDQSLPNLEEDPPIFENWVPSSSVCLEDDKNGNLDLDSLAFLLDSEEWP